jgi:hypothetical protein
MVDGRWSMVDGRLPFSFLLGNPAGLVDLAPSRDTEGAGRHVFDD